MISRPKPEAAFFPLDQRAPLQKTWRPILYIFLFPPSRQKSSHSSVPKKAAHAGFRKPPVHCFHRAARTISEVDFLLSRRTRTLDPIAPRWSPLRHWNAVVCVKGDATGSKEEPASKGSHRPAAKPANQQTPLVTPAPDSFRKRTSSRSPFLPLHLFTCPPHKDRWNSERPRRRIRTCIHSSLHR